MKTTRILNAAPVKLDGMTSKLTTTERGDACRELEGLAAKAAFVSAYLSARYGEGCGDQGHDYAVKCANRARRLVRKAFGYDETPDIRF